MSRLLINRSPALKRLRDEGYEISIHSGRFLLVHHVPYVKGDRTVAYGTLVLELTIAGDVAVKPNTHIVHFMGDQPCHKDGTVIQQIAHGGATQHAPDLHTDRSFSNKPPEAKQNGYADDYARAINYIEHLQGPAQAIDPSAAAKTFIVAADNDTTSVFNYADTASSRTGTAMLAERFAGQKIAIVGLGGTGAYVLDFVAKTPVADIHLFDGDRFYSHNAFRAPGAASLETLRRMPFKVDYLASVYSAQRKGIHPHSHHIDETTLHELAGMDFVFLCVDKPSAKAIIIPHLEQAGIPFIDCGMGIVQNENGLTGQVRTTTSLSSNRDQARAHISTAGEPDGENPYDSNIQIADLNALNALQAVIKWKKLNGFYIDLGHEQNAVYLLATNRTLNEDEAA